MTLASNMNNVVSELYAVLANSNLADMPDKPVDIERDAALSMTLGKQGHPPPWPRSVGEAAAWQIRQIQKLLRQAEILVISPAAHAAVMAAAATLEPADISTLDRDRDILMPPGCWCCPNRSWSSTAPGHFRTPGHSAGSSSPSTRSRPPPGIRVCG